MISAVSSAVQGLVSSMRRMDRAASTVSRSGVSEVTPGPGAPARSSTVADGAGETDPPGAMLEMLLAQRAFSAQLRVIKTADEMSREAVDLLKR